ncbi:MAG: ABC-type polysaccharide/polyol phosphate export permease [Chlamydiales bacterium]
MFSLFSSLAKNRRLLKEFVVRDLKARYVGSSMGFFWSVVFPIINLFVFMFVFRLILKARWSDHQGPIEVALVMLAGIVVWSAFAETVSRTTNTLVDNANLIQKVVFPSELLPVYLTLSSLINMLIGLPVVIGCVGWFGYLSPPTADFQPEVPALVEGGVAHVGVHLTRGLSRDVTIPFDIGGSATLDEDYTIQPRTLTIPSGHLSGTITIHTRTDALEDLDEDIVLTLTRPHRAALGERRSMTLNLANLAAGETPAPIPPAPQAAIDESFRPLKLGAALLALPLLLLLQVIFTSGLGFILATLNVYVRDVFHLVGVFITVWMFSTPIFYPAAMVDNAGYGWILQLNPMHWLIDGYRSVLLYDQWPNWLLLARFGLVGLVVLAIGSTFFMSQKRRFPDFL